MRIFGTWVAIVACGVLSTTPALASGEERGKELIASLGCKGCHKLDGSGGTVGPDLAKVGSRMNEARLRQQLLDPKAINPKSMMPSYQHLPEKDIEAMVDFMEKQK
ncbi:MAG: c-type cytochrome [Desulfuromonadales bacterium]|nr:c-type cytochrome [Desulfuromonadales bacterium]